MTTRTNLHTSHTHMEWIEDIAVVGTSFWIDAVVRGYYVYRDILEAVIFDWTHILRLNISQVFNLWKHGQLKKFEKVCILRNFPAIRCTDTYSLWPISLSLHFFNLTFLPPLLSITLSLSCGKEPRLPAVQVLCWLPAHQPGGHERRIEAAFYAVWSPVRCVHPQTIPGVRLCHVHGRLRWTEDDGPAAHHPWQPTKHHSSGAERIPHHITQTWRWLWLRWSWQLCSWCSTSGFVSRLRWLQPPVLRLWLRQRIQPCTVYITRLPVPAQRGSLQPAATADSSTAPVLL